jgi:hypothetical protein
MPRQVRHLAASLEGAKLRPHTAPCRKPHGRARQRFDDGADVQETLLLALHVQPIG